MILEHQPGSLGVFPQRSKKATENYGKQKTELKLSPAAPWPWAQAQKGDEFVLEPFTQLQAVAANCSQGPKLLHGRWDPSGPWGSPWAETAGVPSDGIHCHTGGWGCNQTSSLELLDIVSLLHPCSIPSHIPDHTLPTGMALLPRASPH